MRKTNTVHNKVGVIIIIFVLCSNCKIRAGGINPLGRINLAQYCQYIFLFSCSKVSQ